MQPSQPTQSSPSKRRHSSAQSSQNQTGASATVPLQRGRYAWQDTQIIWLAGFIAPPLVSGTKGYGAFIFFAFWSILACLWFIFVPEAKPVLYCPELSDIQLRINYFLSQRPHS
ncbi:hypothetical protein J007_05130 [Cryptococcus neoformans]|nr:hypothetical protein J007_05130 [Cryptococcus neoformans var. grubii]OXC61538.1 hypothetical protein C358_03032 [Cryptococcus neoformans var. grubii MW-RSA852]